MIWCVEQQDGAVPEGDPQSAPGAADAQAARLRLLADGRVAGAGAAGVRYDARTWPVRRDGEFEALMMHALFKGLLLCFPPRIMRCFLALAGP